MPSRPRLSHGQHRVTVVLVAHDGAKWLPATLDALSAQTRVAQRVVAVDTGSTDRTRRLLNAAVGADDVVSLPRSTGFGTAVAAAVAHVDEATRSARPRRPAAPGPDDPVEWLWLLHDDCAPEPEALAELLELAAQLPSAGVIGPKARDWDDPRLLIEVGLTIDRAGRRETGLERREFDQGQHDRVRDVLAVGTAGALVRRDVFDAVGGFDPRLPIFRDDIDLGWRVNSAGYRVVVAPQARVRHARAATLGRRPIDAAHGTPEAIDRRHAIAVLLSNMSLPALLPGLPRLLLGALLRAAAFLLTRRLRAARDELAAIAWNLAHLGDLARARGRRRRTRRVPGRALRKLFVGRAARLRGYTEAVTDWLTGGAAPDTGPGAEDEDAPLPSPLAGRLWAVVRRPAVIVPALLVVATLVAARGLLGDGTLVGGGLLPGPSGAGDLWREYAASWHRAGAGTAAPASPSLAVLAALSTVALGKPWLTLDVLVIGAVPLAGIAAYIAMRPLAAVPLLRSWAAASYAVLPVATGAIADGRLDHTVAHIAAPLLLVGGYRVAVEDPGATGWRRPFRLGLGLAVVGAFAPPVLTLAAVLLGVGLAACALLVVESEPGRLARRGAGAALALATAFLVLLPWSMRFVQEPALLLTGTHRSASATPTDGLDLILFRAAPTASLLRWATVGLVLAALAGLLRAERRRVALVGWLVAVAAWLFALAGAHTVSSAGRGSPAPALVFAAAGLLVAAVVAAQGARARLARQSFGWRQPLAAVVAGLAAVLPVLLVGAWIRDGAAGALDRRTVGALPAFAVVEGNQRPGTRMLWLATEEGQRSTSAPAGVRYTLTGVAGPRLGDAELPVDVATKTLLDDVVADLASPRGTDAAEALATFAVRYVVVPQPVEPALGRALDVQPGLSRTPYVGSVQLWRVLAPTGRLTLLDGPLAQAARSARAPRRDQLRAAPPRVLPARAEAATANLPAGAPGRLLVLSERTHRRWVATIGGQRLTPVTAWGWAQAFQVPSAGGRVRVERSAGGRRLALGFEGALLAIAVVLAAPSVRRGDPTDEDPTDEYAGVEPDSPPKTHEPAVPQPAGARSPRPKKAST